MARRVVNAQSPARDLAEPTTTYCRLPSNLMQTPPTFKYKALLNVAGIEFEMAPSSATGNHNYN